MKGLQGLMISKNDASKSRIWSQGSSYILGSYSQLFIRIVLLMQNRLDSGVLSVELKKNEIARCYRWDDHIGTRTRYEGLFTSTYFETLHLFLLIQIQSKEGHQVTLSFSISTKAFYAVFQTDYDPFFEKPVWPPELSLLNCRRKRPFLIMRFGHWITDRLLRFFRNYCIDQLKNYLVAIQY